MSTKQSTDQYFLLLNCKVYNSLSEVERKTTIGRRVYEKMKKLNEKILAQ